MGESYEGIIGRRSRDDEHESRSGSDNMDGGSGDDQDAADNPPRKKRYHRHTPQQIQELEAYVVLYPKSISFSLLCIHPRSIILIFFFFFLFQQFVQRVSSSR